jgi:hypothetical protein
MNIRLESDCNGADIRVGREFATEFSGAGDSVARGLFRGKPFWREISPF